MGFNADNLFVSDAEQIALAEAISRAFSATKCTGPGYIVP
jgi:hypothetical protein